MGRPKKAPADKMVRIYLTLRPYDIQALQLLALERFGLDVGAAIEAAGPEARKARFDQRPSVSYAVRYLIDAERERRLALARERASGGELRHLESTDQKNLTDALIPPFGPGARSSEAAALNKLVPLVPEEPTKRKRTPTKKRKAR